jgi:hypothetical protein
MPAKSTSPEAAQRKVWKAEIRSIQNAGIKIIRDFNAEERRLEREVDKADKARNAAFSKLNKFKAGRNKKEARELSQIQRRIAILEGRIGI